MGKLWTLDPPRRKRGWEHVREWVNEKGPDECWPWKLKPSRYGYGRYAVLGQWKHAHRAVYEQHHQVTLDKGVVVDHLCHNRDLTCTGGRTCLHRLCCNPAHLEAVSVGENIRRSYQANNGKRRK